MEKVNSEFIRNRIQEERQDWPVSAQSNANGDLEVGLKRRTFPARIIISNDDGAQEIDRIEDAPDGVRIFVATESGDLISEARKHDNGAFELLGGNVEDMQEYLKNSLQIGTLTLGKSLTALGTVAGSETAEEWGDALQGYQDKITSGMSPQEQLARQRGFGPENPESVADIVAASLPFHAGFRAMAAAGKALGGLRGEALSAQFGNAAMNSGIVMDEVRRTLMEHGASEEVANEAARKGGIMPAIVSAMTARFQTGKAGGGLGGPAGEGITEVIEEITQAESIKQFANVPYDKSETAAAAFIGGYGSEATLMPLMGVMEEFKQYPVVRALNKRAATLQKMNNSSTQTGTTMDGGKEVVKMLADLAKWGGRRKEVMKMTEDEVKINFGRFFDEDEYNFVQIKKMVMDAANIFKEFGKKELTPQAQRDNMGGFGIAQLADSGNQGARNFLSEAAAVMGLSPDTDNAYIGDTFDKLVPDVQGIWRDYRGARLLEDVFPEIVREGVNSVPEAKTKIVELDPQGCLNLRQSLVVKPKGRQKRD